jgi:hypothetical protein
MDGTTLRIVKGPNVKKLMSLAAFAGLVATTMAPAMAANTVTIKWNVTAIASLILEGNYSNTGAGGTTALAPLTVGGGTNCAAGGAAPVGNGSTALTIDFGNITPSATSVVGCVGLNAAEAQVSTNDTSGVQVQEALSTAPAQAGAAICGVSVQGGKAAAWSATGMSTATLTAAGAFDSTDTTAASWAGTSCAGLTYGGTSVGATQLAAAASTIVNTNNNTLNPFYQGEDYVVMIPANASKGADSGVVTYTLVTN